MNGILLDENLPAALDLPTQLPIRHVGDLGLSLTDTQVWNAAKQGAWIVVTKDSDFLQRALVFEPPPWVVHLRLGNLRLRPFRDTIQQLWPSIEAAFPYAKIVSAYADRLEIIR